MRKFFFAFFAILLIAGAQAQYRNSETVFDRLVWNDEMLNIKLDTRNDFRTDFNNGNFDNASFQAHTLKLWVSGEIVPGVRYRLRHRLNKPQNPLGRDRLSSATDQAWIQFDAGERWTFTVGKQSVQFGTFEYDYNPADVYVPTMCFDDLDAYKMGINIARHFGNQTLNFQVINSDAPQFASPEYASRALAGLLLWEGKLFDNLIGTRWGYGIFQHSGDKCLNWITVGTQLNLGKFTTELDYYFGDRYMNYSSVVDGNRNFDAFVLDQSVSLNFKYDFGKWKPFIKGVWNQRYDKSPLDGGISHFVAYETSGVQAVVEYYPFLENKYMQDLRFHAMLAYNTTDFKGAFAHLESQNSVTALVGMRWLFKAK